METRPRLSSKALIEAIIGGRPEKFAKAVNAHRDGTQSTFYPDGEYIAAAAFFRPKHYTSLFDNSGNDGDIFTGDDHMAAVHAAYAYGHYPEVAQALRSAKIPGGRLWTELFARGWKLGFLTSKDRFVDRREAMDIAHSRGQVSDDTYSPGALELDSWDIR